ncbi:hypothetical protein [Falsiroseomonas tokyonensis]|uniref:Uncharacterized protein n=1 Tax=Falsiroseomonas tokyonensis TaxID=430521 RepID=A0ABV7BS20_9PROT|nr:hypothetical protein [Falsiroseomonas tokyonensis]MBU8538335.1 hypothetical protein [Falsiroseomonas tokyonensis]
MTSARIARQTIPLWFLRTDDAGLPEEATGRGAKVIRLPPPSARRRRVLTYPAAIAIPSRAERGMPEAPLPLTALLALATPTALLGFGMLLLQLLA